jgi:hypothetical protein
VALQLEQGKQYVYKSGIDIVKADDGCTFDEAAVALACAYSDNLAVQAKREVSKLYEDITKPPYKLLFSSRLSATRMWRSVLVLRQVGASLKPMQTSDAGRKRLIAVHGNRFILHRVFRKTERPAR